MDVIAVYNFKGGVGKTAAAVNLGWLSAHDGVRTLVWDLDPQGAATFTFRVRPRLSGGARGLLRGGGDLTSSIRATDFPGLDLLPADFSCRNLDVALEGQKHPERRIEELLRPLAGEYDRTLLDCAPSISVVSESVFSAASVLLAPTLPTPLSLRTLARLMKHLKQRDDGAPRVLPFFSMVDRRKKLHREIIEYARESALGFLDTSIPYSSKVEQMATLRAPVCAFAPRDRASRAYEDLWREVGLRGAQANGRAPSSKSIKGLVRDVTRSPRR